MTLRNSTPNWTWTDETEEVVSRLFIERGVLEQRLPLNFTGGRRSLIEWCVKAAMQELRGRATLNEIAAAVADHMPR